MTAKAKNGPGRPKGTRDPNFVARMRRRLPKIYDAQIRAAENGSTEAARFCLDVIKNPGSYPDDRQP